MDARLIANLTLIRLIVSQTSADCMLICKYFLWCFLIVLCFSLFIGNHNFLLFHFWKVSGTVELHRINHLNLKIQQFLIEFWANIPRKYRKKKQNLKCLVFRIHVSFYFYTCRTFPEFSLIFPNPSQTLWSFALPRFC